VKRIIAKEDLGEMEDEEERVNNSAEESKSTISDEIEEFEGEKDFKEADDDGEKFASASEVSRVSEALLSGLFYNEWCLFTQEKNNYKSGAAHHDEA